MKFKNAGSKYAALKSGCGATAAWVPAPPWATMEVPTQPSSEGAGKNMVETHAFPRSGTLVKAAYNTETGLLQLWFTGNPQGYDYPHVPAHLWAGLKLAPSAGRYYNLHIRDQYGQQPKHKSRSWPRR